MKKKYIATFFSHFGAIRFQKNLQNIGGGGVIMPVPRALSSSCGTCVSFESEGWDIQDNYSEIEQIVQVTQNGYECVYRAENS